VKRALIVAGAIGAVVGAFACGVLTVPPEPSAPVNTCPPNDNSFCGARYPDASLAPLCFGGACVEGSSFVPILVVSVPEGPFSTFPGIAGTTFGLPDTYQSNRLHNVPPGCVENASNFGFDFECDFLTPLSQILPSLNLRVSKEYGVKLWPPGLRPNQPDPQLPVRPFPTALPIHGTFRPMWIDPATGTPMLARRLGLPLDDRDATVTFPTTKTFSGTVTLYGPTTSTTALPQNGTDLSVTLPQPLAPTDPSGKYQLVVTPDSPFEVFPPFVTRGSADPSDATKTIAWDNLDVSPSEVTRGAQQFDLASTIPIFTETPAVGQPTVLFSNTYEVDELADAPSLAGWTMHIDVGEGNAPTGVDDDAVRVSGLVTLPAGGVKNVPIWWATGTLDQTNETLFIDPPPGVDLPRYVAPNLNGAISGVFQYPGLPPMVPVSGQVTRVDTLQPISASVVFFANGDTGAALLEFDGTTFSSNLLYEKRVTAQGQMNATLPPGTLRAYVIPDDPDLAITVQPFSVSDSSGQPQNGKGLVANPRPHVRGHVVLADGTPLYAADVVIDASADDPFLPQDDPLQRPRESRGMTDASGNFDVPSDPGLVDISIRPHDGTAFPWMVLTQRTVVPNVPGDGGSSGGLTLAGDVVVPLPAPFVRSVAVGAITDVSGNLLPHTTIRAYAFPPGGQPDAGASATRGARLIGSTVTDAQGFFQLFVAPPQ
jgi:hypothetical protein